MNKLKCLIFSGEDIQFSPGEVQNLIESCLNDLGTITSESKMEVFVTISDVNAVQEGKGRWSKFGKRSLSNRKGKKVLLYNKDTQFWMIINNTNFPDGFKSFLKENPDLFTHCITLAPENLERSFLNSCIHKLHINTTTNTVKEKYEFLKAKLIELSGGL